MSHIVYMFFFINTLNNKTKHNEKEGMGKYQLEITRGMGRWFSLWDVTQVWESEFRPQNLHKKAKELHSTPGNLALEAVLEQQADPQRTLAALQVHWPASSLRNPISEQ